MNYAELLHKKFMGCSLLATMSDTSRERTVKIYYIGSLTHVGLNDGVDVFISPVKGCLHSLPVGFLEKQLVLAAEGKIAPEQTVTVRKTINRPLPVKIMHRRESTHV